MSDDLPQLRADPALVEAWLRGRSLARGLPQPEPDSGGLRLEVGLPQERRRYVFARTTQGLRQLAQTIVEPLVFLKLCSPVEVLRALAPTRWALQPVGYMMTRAASIRTDRPRLPGGYRLELIADGPAVGVRILTDAGELAASGRAGEYDGALVYDQIVTDPAHRRRGLGRAVMAALDAAREGGTRTQVLVATDEGRALYSTLGFEVHAPFASAVIPASGSEAIARQM